uniref:Uncharacterized protein n=1 Tax=Arundo donax TaxID=35708 RepID=A0A0A8Y2F4_ARUDO
MALIMHTPMKTPSPPCPLVATSRIINAKEPSKKRENPARFLRRVFIFAS